MEKIKIEFFHDVICSYCFPMSYRMRKLKALMPEIEVVHRSFVLIRDENDFNRMFGSRVSAKGKLLSHWESANKNDDLHRFNTQQMEKTTFLFPTSMPSLWACKAAYFIAGEDAQWDMFDQLQKALFIDSKDVGSDDVIFDCAKSAGLDLKLFKEMYPQEKVKNAVEADMKLVDHYNIKSVPHLVVNEKHMISGAIPLDEIHQAILRIKKETNITDTTGKSCSLSGGKVDCE